VSTGGLGVLWGWVKPQGGLESPPIAEFRERVTAHSRRGTMFRAIWIELFIVLDMIGILWDIHFWLPTILRWF
jgi:hypothetical protein